MADHQIDAQQGQGESSKVSIADRLKAFAVTFDRQFAGYLGSSKDVPLELAKAMRYAALASGKRMRPYLVTRCCELVGGRTDEAAPVAAAIECVHAFSLIHDDLPAMDNDDRRRGQPTCHKKFGEALAILAGDALVVRAFELLTGHVTDRALAAELALELANGAGWSGMIGGQTADVLGMAQPPTLELAKYIHERKTAGLFRAACRLGALTGRAGPEPLTALGEFGQSLGRAFQIADDLLDITSTPEVLGKGVGKDAAANKQTFPQCVGMEESRTAAGNAANAALTALEPFGADADDLRSLTSYVVSRNY